MQLPMHIQNPHTWIFQVQLHKISNHEHRGFLSQSQLSFKITPTCPFNLAPAFREVKCHYCHFGVREITACQWQSWPGTQLSSLPLPAPWAHSPCSLFVPHFCLTPTLLWISLHHYTQVTHPASGPTLCWSHPPGSTLAWQQCTVTGTGGWQKCQLENKRRRHRELEGQVLLGAAPQTLLVPESGPIHLETACGSWC